MNKPKEFNGKSFLFEQGELETKLKRRGPGRGIGEKRINQERLDMLKTLFQNLENIHRFLIQEGHSIINESGSILSSGSHDNLDQMLVLLEDFLWTLNCSIAKNGGDPRLLR
ncbi:MAG: hypothetical protein ACFFCF_00920 [Promethearchaeota archaeon]